MLTKYATFEVLSADLAAGRGLRAAHSAHKQAHRAAFEYDPRPGFIYVRSRAISSRTNDNYDHFPAEEIRKAYRSFVGKPVFVNHHNDNHRRARGVIIDAALHEDANPDGSPDTWVEVLMEVDAVRFPKLAEAILKGHIDRTSMGTDVAYSVCTFCGNRASTPLEYCRHIPRMKGQRIRRTLASGAVEDVLVAERCYGLRFFENSLLVEDPADPTAFFLDVDDRGIGGGYRGNLALAKAASKLAVERESECAICGSTSFTKLNASWDVCENDHLVPVYGREAVASVGYRYECALKATMTCDKGSGKPSRKKCSRCGGALLVWQGVYGVFEWDQTARYPLDAAIATYTNEAKAEAKVKELNAQGGNTVVRFVSQGTPTRTSSFSWEHDSPDYERPVARPAAPPRETYEGTDQGGEWEDGYRDALQGSPARTIASAPYYEGYEYGSQLRTFEQDVPYAASRRTASRRTAIDEQKAPPEVDTLRDETCPVCGEEDTYDGDRCMVCGFVKPPDQFMDPDLDKAQDVNLRQDVEDAADEQLGTNEGDLKCDNCGETFSTDDEPEGAPAEGEEDEGEEKKADPDVVPKAPDPDDAGSVDPKLDNSLPHPKRDDETDQDVVPQTAPEAGDPCPKCGEGTLQPLAEPDSAEDGRGGEQDTDDEDEEDDSPPWVKKKDDKKSSRRLTPEGVPSMARPALEALAEQQKMIESQSTRITALEDGLRFVAEVAGISNHPRVVALFKGAATVEENPAQPGGWAITEPTSQPTEAPPESTQEAASPTATDDPENQGSSPLTDVTPDATTSVDSGETSLDEPLDLSEQDPTKAVDGTTDVRPLSETKTETEIRAGDPNNPQEMWPLEGDFATRPTAAKEEPAKEGPGEGRVFASLRLARLRIQAGIEQADDDLALGTSIAGSEMTDEAIQHEIDTLAKVVTASAQPQPRTASRSLVPQSAGRVTRTLPSMQSPPTERPHDESLQVTAGAAPSDDEFLWD